MPNKQIDPERLARRLQPVYQYLSRQYTKGIRVPETLPTRFRRDFYESLETYDRTMSEAISTCVVHAYQEQPNLSGALRVIDGEMQRQTKRLSNTFYQAEVRGHTYEALVRDPDYPMFLYLSESGENTCDSCQSHHGSLFSASELIAIRDLIPPVHPNCKCRLVAMDTRMATQYNNGKKDAFIAALETAMVQYAPVYRLDHRAAQLGISPATLAPLQLPQDPVVTEAAPEGPSWWEQVWRGASAWLSNAWISINDWGKQFLADAMDLVDGLLERGKTRLEQAVDADGLLSILLFGDFLLGTMPSAFLEGAADRWRRFLEEPSVYDALNNLTLGLGDQTQNAIFPEKPWSFQHFMDMAGVVTLITGIAMGVKGVMDADGILGERERSAYASLDDGLDDAARAAAQQMDDLVEDAAEQLGTVVKAVPAEAANHEFILHNPTFDPPYWPGTTVYDVRLSEQTRFVRVYSERLGQFGRWFMAADDVAGLTAQQIMDKFSLPEKPLYICDVELPVGTVVQVSGAGGILGGAGGGVQIFVNWFDNDWFKNEQVLP